jgi:hypothetical protein
MKGLAANEQAARGVEAFALAREGNFAIDDGEAATGQGVIAIIFSEKRGEGVLLALGPDAQKLPGNFEKDIVHVEGFAGDEEERSEAIADGARGVGGIDVDVEADADQIDAIDALAEEAGEFFVVVDNVVGPFEADGMIAGKLGGGVADGEAGDEGDLVGIAGVVDGENEGDGEGAFLGPPGIAASAAAGDLIRSEDDGGSEEIAALAKKGGVVVGGTQAGEEVEAEGAEVFLETREIERIGHEFKSLLLGA